METLLAKHVPELDGLRGIAITSVIIHHQLAPISLSGGFLGVDLFFVLSGFLITSLLLAEFAENNKINLRKFYMRRLLRLGPALSLYLVAALLVAYFTQSISIIQQLKLIALTVFYLTNWRMALGWDSALDSTAITWSLSIEEQFYLVWPLLLTACLALRLKLRFIAGGLAIVILGIVVHRYALLEAEADLTRLYYGSDTRADALLVGCIFGLLNSKMVRLGNNVWLLKTAALVSASGLGFLILTSHFGDLFLYRGGFTAIAILAGVLIYVAANAPPRVLSATLRFPPLIWLGHISYGLYLWHWLVVRNVSFYSLGRWEPTAKLALAIGIAATSFYFFEKPINRLKTRFASRTPRLPVPPPTISDNVEPHPAPIAEPALTASRN
ncbi:MAG TPA: acyltransferase [Pyrinomonadaceae bacterium]|nr:acyltransferase [Pyrinomonadaceae bacterium]